METGKQIMKRKVLAQELHSILKNNKQLTFFGRYPLEVVFEGWFENPRRDIFIDWLSVCREFSNFEMIQLINLYDKVRNNGKTN